MNTPIGVIGATGAVGRAMLDVLAERGVSGTAVRALASSRSAGTRVRFGGGEIPVEELSDRTLSGLAVALFALDDAQAREWVPVARGLGVPVVDNSAVYRMDPAVPLVVPEVNGDLLEREPMLVANPNCSTIILVVALAPLARAAGARRVTAVTFQSASGAGSEAITELADGARAILDQRPAPASVFPVPLAFDCLPQIGALDDDGHSREERKVVRETRRILDLPDLAISVTCVRVPTFISHALAVHLETERPLAPREAEEILRGASGVVVGGRTDPGRWPTPREVAGDDRVFVGRVRGDLPAGRGIAFWVVGDNLRKGAATNAIQIASHRER